MIESVKWEYEESEYGGYDIYPASNHIASLNEPREDVFANTRFEGIAKFIVNEHNHTLESSVPTDDYEAVIQSERNQAIVPPQPTPIEIYNKNTDAYIEAAEMWYERAAMNVEESGRAYDLDVQLRLAEIACQIVKARGLRHGLS